MSQWDQAEPGFCCTSYAVPETANKSLKKTCLGLLVSHTLQK